MAPGYVGANAIGIRELKVKKQIYLVLVQKRIGQS